MELETMDPVVEMNEPLYEEFGFDPEIEEVLDWEAEGDREGDYQIIGRDDRRRVRNPRRIPFRYICKLEMGGGTCTGTLIAPNKVLTAAHCLYSRRRKRSATRVRVIPAKIGAGSSRRTEPFGHAWMARMHMRPEYRTESRYWDSARYDYAVITLNRALGRRIGWWRRIRAFSPKMLRQIRLNTAGYPGDKGGQHLYYAHERVVKVRGQFVEYLNDTMPGQSGSPVWARRGNVRTLVAIHKRADDPRTGPVANVGVRITPRVLADLRRWCRT